MARRIEYRLSVFARDCSHAPLRYHGQVLDRPTRTAAESKVPASGNPSAEPPPEVAADTTPVPPADANSGTAVDSPARKQQEMMSKLQRMYQQRLKMNSASQPNSTH